MSTPSIIALRNLVADAEVQLQVARANLAAADPTTRAEEFTLIATASLGALSNSIGSINAIQAHAQVILDVAWAAEGMEDLKHSQLVNMKHMVYPLMEALTKAAIIMPKCDVARNLLLSEQALRE